MKRVVKGAGGLNLEPRKINEAFTIHLNFFKVFRFHIKSVRDGMFIMPQAQYTMTIESRAVPSVQGAKTPETSEIWHFWGAK